MISHSYYFRLFIKGLNFIFLLLFLLFLFINTSHASDIQSTYNNQVVIGNGQFYLNDKSSKLVRIIDTNGKGNEIMYDNNGNIQRKDGNRVLTNEVSYTGASYEIIVFGLNSAIQQVLFPTWTAENGQDDIQWYSGTRISEGVWKTTIPFNNHNHKLGYYITHVYTDYNFFKEIYVDVKNTTSIQSNAEIPLGNGSYEIIVSGVASNVSKVIFPTWTELNSQDDIRWNEGSKIGEGAWKITIPFSEHNYEDGGYTTHIYSTDDKGNQVFLGYSKTNVVSAKMIPLTGYYKIQAKQSGKVIDVIGASLDNGIKIQQYDYWGGNNQKWEFQDSGNGYFRIKSKHSGKFLDVIGVSTANEANIQQYDYAGGDNQLWRLIDAGDGFVQIRAKHSGKVLDVTGASSANETLIQQYDYLAGENQKWKLIQVEAMRTNLLSNGFYKIQAKHSGKVFDVIGVSYANEARIQQYDYLGGDNQKWQFEDIGNGFYKIKSKHSGKVLDVIGVSTENGAKIQQYDFAGGGNQLWQFIEVGDGFVQIRAQHSGKVLDVTGASLSNEALIQQYDYLDSDNQKWSLIQVE